MAHYSLIAFGQSKLSTMTELFQSKVRDNFCPAAPEIEPVVETISELTFRPLMIKLIIIYFFFSAAYICIFASRPLRLGITFFFIQFFDACKWCWPRLCGLCWWLVHHGHHLVVAVSVAVVVARGLQANMPTPRPEDAQPLLGTVHRAAVGVANIVLCWTTHSTQRSDACVEMSMRAPDFSYGIVYGWVLLFLICLRYTIPGHAVLPHVRRLARMAVSPIPDFGAMCGIVWVAVALVYGAAVMRPLQAALWWLAGVALQCAGFAAKLFAYVTTGVSVATNLGAAAGTFSGFFSGLAEGNTGTFMGLGLLYGAKSLGPAIWSAAVPRLLKALGEWKGDWADVVQSHVLPVARAIAEQPPTDPSLPSDGQVALTGAVRALSSVVETVRSSGAWDARELSAVDALATGLRALTDDGTAPDRIGRTGLSPQRPTPPAAATRTCSLPPPPPIAPASHQLRPPAPHPPRDPAPPSPPRASAPHAARAEAHAARPPGAQPSADHTPLPVARMADRVASWCRLPPTHVWESVQTAGFPGEPSGALLEEIVAACRNHGPIAVSYAVGCAMQRRQRTMQLLTALKSGRLPQSYAVTPAAACPRSRRTAHASVQTDAVRQQVLRLLAAGSVKEAMHAWRSRHDAGRQPDDVAAHIAALFPARRPCDAAVRAPNAAELVAAHGARSAFSALVAPTPREFEDLVRGAIRAAAVDAAPGCSGFRTAWLRALADQPARGGRKVTGIRVVAEWVDAMLTGAAPELMNTVRLCLIPKARSDKFRPIGVPEALAAVAKRVVLRRLTDVALPALEAGGQWLLAPSGTLKAAAILQAAHAAGWSVYALDIANAFNAVSRAAVVDAVAAYAPELTAIVRLCLAPTRVVVPSASGHRAFTCDRGVVQGDPLSGVLFALTLCRVLATWVRTCASAGIRVSMCGPDVREGCRGDGSDDPSCSLTWELGAVPASLRVPDDAESPLHAPRPDLVVLAYADDVSIVWRDADTLARAVGLLTDALDSVGLTVAPAKSAIIAGGSLAGGPAGAAAAAAAIGAQVVDAHLILGVPVGAAAAAEALVLGRIASIEADFVDLWALECPYAEVLALRLAGPASKLRHVLEGAAPWVVSGTVVDALKAMEVRVITHVLGPYADRATPGVVLLMSRAMKSGGLGLQRASEWGDVMRPDSARAGTDGTAAGRCAFARDCIGRWVPYSQAERAHVESVYWSALLMPSASRDRLLAQAGDAQPAECATLQRRAHECNSHRHAFDWVALPEAFAGWLPGITQATALALALGVPALGDALLHTPCPARHASPQPVDGNRHLTSCKSAVELQRHEASKLRLGLELRRCGLVRAVDFEVQLSRAGREVRGENAGAAVGDVVARMRDGSGSMYFDLRYMCADGQAINRNSDPTVAPCEASARTKQRWIDSVLSDATRRQLRVIPVGISTTGAVDTAARDVLSSMLTRAAIARVVAAGLHAQATAATLIIAEMTDSALQGSLREQAKAARAAAIAELKAIRKAAEQARAAEPAVERAVEAATAVRRRNDADAAATAAWRSHDAIQRAAVRAHDQFVRRLQEAAEAEQADDDSAAASDGDDGVAVVADDARGVHADGSDAGAAGNAGAAGDAARDADADACDGDAAVGHDDAPFVAFGVDDQWLAADGSALGSPWQADAAAVDDRAGDVGTDRHSRASSVRVVRAASSGSGHGSH